MRLATDCDPHKHHQPLMFSVINVYLRTLLGI